MADWHELFDTNDFELILRQPLFCDIKGLPIHPRFGHYSDEDLRCTILTLVHRKAA
jgi:hypothetical protein